MKNMLQQYFPMIRTKEELMSEIKKSSVLSREFYSWEPEARKKFIDFCTGAKGVKMMYDFISKEILNPETVPERVDELLSLLLGQEVHVKDVYTIVLFEQSPGAFHEFPDNYLHQFHQCSNTGLKLNLLQKYLFVPLDIFLDSLQYKDIKIQNRLDAWLAFLGSDDPEIIIDIIERYPDFKEMYQQVYDICRNIEEVMGMFSKELLEMDRNTVELMIDEMQDEIKQQKEVIQQKDSELQEMQQKMKDLQEELERTKDLK